MAPTEYRIGTSGWHYKHWRGAFYPRELAVKRWLSYYAERFTTVEVNNSFYRLPTRETMQNWHDATPRGFRFAVKASRYLTHYKRLREPEEPMERLLDRIAPLGPKQGPLLFQLPPRWPRDVGRLQAFIDNLPRGFECAFEFRDPSWEHRETFRALAMKNAAFCVFDLAGHQTPYEITADFTYVRLHGPQGRYGGSYDTRSLRGWADRLRSRALRRAYVYFDNDQAGYAPANALLLGKYLADG